MTIPGRGKRKLQRSTTAFRSGTRRRGTWINFDSVHRAMTAGKLRGRHGFFSSSWKTTTPTEPAAEARNYGQLLYVVVRCSTLTP